VFRNTFTGKEAYFHRSIFKGMKFDSFKFGGILYFPIAHNALCVTADTSICLLVATALDMVHFMHCPLMTDLAQTGENMNKILV